MDVEKLRFEKFMGFGSKMSRKISVTKNYSFGISPIFYSENNLDGFDFVELYFDPSEKAIALHFIKEKSDACLKMIKYGEGDKRGASVVAKSFFTRYDIEPKRVSGKYDPIKVTREGLGDLFVIQLKEHPVSEPEPSDEAAV